MTRLSARQRRVLQELAHMRVPREDAWMTTRRVNALAGGASARDVLGGLEFKGLVERETFSGRHRWRITDAGREALI